MRNVDRIDHAVLNAGILEYPNVGTTSPLAFQILY